MTAIFNGSTETRARGSRGDSSAAIHAMVAGVVARRASGGVLVDVGCGRGALRQHISHLCHRYIGVDALRYDDFPRDCDLHLVNLDAEDWNLPKIDADVVAAVETIEHLENPRAFVRQLLSLCRPGGLIVVTTPNQLSLLSKLTLLIKNEFNAFQERPGLYPSHLTALLEVDLTRIARECGLVNVEFEYSHDGRIPGTSFRWPKIICRRRAFSDNVMLSANVRVGHDRR